MVPRDTRWVIRYGFTGLFAVTVVALSLATVERIPIPSHLIVPIVAAASVIGFVLDAVSAYKAHPTYRRLRRSFFFALARCERPLESARSAKTVEAGEDIRETTLYELDGERRADLGVEHAVWIAAFHMHLILAGAAILLALGSLVTLVFGLPHFRTGIAALLVVVYAGLAVVSLVAATARLRSYNAKVLNLTRQRTATTRRGTLRSALETITDCWPDPDPGERAFRLCQAAHDSQTRDDGAPYVFHPVRVALLLRCELDVLDPETLILALLHDVLEAPPTDQPTTAQLVDGFGPELAAECELLTTKRGSTRAERDANHLASVAAAPPRVRMVKLADRIDNVRSLSTNPDRAKAARYLVETERHYLGLAAETDLDALGLLEAAIADARSAQRLRPPARELARNE